LFKYAKPAPNRCPCKPKAEHDRDDQQMAPGGAAPKSERGNGSEEPHHECGGHGVAQADHDTEEQAAERRAYSRRGLELARRSNAADAELANLGWLVVSLALEEPRQPEAARGFLAEMDDRVREIGDPVQRAKAMAMRTRLAWEEAETSGAGPEATALAFETHLQHLQSIEAIRRNAEWIEDEELKAAMLSLAESLKTTR